jgi:hypothetical protein
MEKPALLCAIGVVGLLGCQAPNDPADNGTSVDISQGKADVQSQDVLLKAGSTETPSRTLVFLPPIKPRSHLHATLSYDGDAQTKLRFSADSMPPLDSAVGLRPELDADLGLVIELPMLAVYNYSPIQVSAHVNLDVTEKAAPPGVAFGLPCQDLPGRMDCQDGLVCLTYGDGGPNHDGFCSAYCNPESPVSCPTAPAGQSGCFAANDKGYCAIYCGASYGGDACPSGLTCQRKAATDSDGTCARSPLP